MQQIKAELLPGDSKEKPFKVVVSRQGKIIAKHPVVSSAAGHALIRDILDGGAQATMKISDISDIID